MALVSLGMFLGRALRRKEAHRAERLPVDGDTLSGDPFTNQFGSDGGKQDAVAKMACGHQQAVQIGGAENGEMVRGIGAQAGPGFFDGGVPQSRRDLHRGAEDFLQTSGRETLLETGVFHGAASNQPAIVARHNVDAFGPQHAFDVDAWSAQRHHLPARRTYRSVRRNSSNLGGKTTGGEYQRACGNRFAGRDYTRAAVSFAEEPRHLLAGSKLHAPLFTRDNSPARQP